MANVMSNRYKFQLLSGNIDFDADTHKIILMVAGFTFDADIHANYSDVVSSELDNGYGYTTAGNTLAGVVVTEDDTNNRGSVSWDDATWTSLGGSIGPSSGAIIYHDTGVAITSTVIGFIDFTSAQIASGGGILTITNIEVRQT